MTPKRKAALQWIHDQSEVRPAVLFHHLSRRMVHLMEQDQQISAREVRMNVYSWSLTDKGRQDLHEA